MVAKLIKMVQTSSDSPRGFQCYRSPSRRLSLFTEHVAKDQTHTAASGMGMDDPYNDIDQENNCTAQVATEQSFDTPNRNDLMEKGLDLREKWCVLGRGGFGTVIKGNYKGKRIAVKMIHKDQHNSSLEALLNESNAVELYHPNIIKVLKVVNSNGKYGLVLMERNIGINMQDFLSDSSHNLHIEKRIRYASHIANALLYCHSNNILHLDVKPKNILICFINDTCKLCDFGSSMKIQNPETATIPQKNMRINTVFYAAPELFMGRIPTTKADVYSFAITLWQMLSRTMPYEGLNNHSVIYKVVSEDYRPKCLENVDDCEKPYIEIYQVCWNGSPLKRPEMPHIIENLQKLKAFMHLPR